MTRFIFIYNSGKEDGNLLINRSFVGLVSVTVAGVCILLWGISIGTVLDMPILWSSDLTSLLSGEGELEHGWARFYVGMLAFALAMFVMVLFAGLKAWLLPRNVEMPKAWAMEMERAHKNTWALLVSLKGNFR